jgi:1,3-propanediol dehydrogenase
MNITKFVAPEIIFGEKALAQVGESAVRLGATKVFLVSDEGVINAGWVEKALPYLKQAGIQYEIWHDVTANPKDYEVERGVEAYLQADCDAVLALGGGSPIDLAKAIAILAANGGTIKDYEGVNKIDKPLPPMIAVPSTAGSGSEVSQFSIIVDSDRKLKMTIISKSLIPDIAIADPAILSTKSSQLTAATGMDALTHAIEAYVSLASTPLTDIHALNAIKLIAANLRESVASATNRQAKEAMAMASLQAGLAFSNAILGMVHAMAHQLGGILDMPHGEANAILLPYVMEYNLISTVDKFAEIAKAFGENELGLSKRNLAEKAVLAVQELARDIDIPTSLSEFGLKEEYLEEMSLGAVKDACLITNPRDAGLREIMAVFQKAL